MKETGECPKCQGTNIWNNRHVAIKMMLPRRSILVKASRFPHGRKYAFKDEYVCLDCGYSETYIDRGSIQLIKKFGYPEDK
ncbi:MAG: hypothetical protein ACW98Y_17555 [Candidatus Thorarchaeota archaeon]|jgi:predicted nucleic-acid-binding Zn-ribbon protein